MNIARELDKFYTNEDVVIKLIKSIDFSEYDLIIEPSAGDGAFSNNINSENLIALDIYPEGANIIKQDWFDFEVPKKYKNVLIIGNPPFGKRNKLSKSFLEHAFSFNNVNNVSFVLPNVYKKYTNQKVIPSGFGISKITPIQDNGFNINGEKYNVPCSFFEFTRKPLKDLRQKYSIDNDYFEFSNKDDYDFFVFGAAPHNVITKPSKNNRGYYIKSKIDKNNLKEMFKNIDWKGHSSANGGVAWFTKVDINEGFIK